MFCKNCGKEIDDKAVICVHCGVQTDNKIQSVASAGEKSWIVALLLCLLLGGFGAHRFYTNHKGSGIAQLLLSLSAIGLIISGPWALIDLVSILCGDFKTKNGESLVK